MVTRYSLVGSENYPTVRAQTVRSVAAGDGNDTKNADLTRVGQRGAEGFGSASRSGEDRSPAAGGPTG
jgi:hypothetical protein